MARGRNSKINATGRNAKKDRFVRLPHIILNSEAYRSLNPTARALLVELAMLENSKNNGSLYLSTRDATNRLGLVDQRPVMRAFDQLVDRGLIRLTKKAHFNIKAADTSRARCWRLTWVAWNNKPPSSEWEGYVAPAETIERRRTDRAMTTLKKYKRALTSHRLPGVDFTATSQIPAGDAQQPVVHSTTAMPKKRGIPPILVGEECSAHTAVTITPFGSAWWSRGFTGRFDPSALSTNVNDNDLGRQGPGSPN